MNFMLTWKSNIFLPRRIQIKLFISLGFFKKQVTYLMKVIIQQICLKEIVYTKKKSHKLHYMQNLVCFKILLFHIIKHMYRMQKPDAETNITCAYKLMCPLRKMKFHSVITPFLHRRHKEIYGTNYSDNEEGFFFLFQCNPT